MKNWWAAVLSNFIIIIISHYLKRMWAIITVCETCCLYLLLLTLYNSSVDGNSHVKKEFWWFKNGNFHSILIKASKVCRALIRKECVFDPLFYLNTKRQIFNHQSRSTICFETAPLALIFNHYKTWKEATARLQVTATIDDFNPKYGDDRFRGGPHS